MQLWHRPLWQDQQARREHLEQVAQAILHPEDRSLFLRWATRLEATYLLQDRLRRIERLEGSISEKLPALREALADKNAPEFPKPYFSLPKELSSSREVGVIQQAAIELLQRPRLAPKIGHGLVYRVKQVFGLDS